MRHLSRRAALALGAGSAAITLIGWNGGAFATPRAATDDIAKFTGGATPEKGKTVPLSFTVDAPMTDADYVSDVLVVAEGNPNPGVATFHFTALSGKAEASTRIRLATTQNIVVVAKTSGGKFYTAQKLVKVTIGGCGG